MPNFELIWLRSVWGLDYIMLPACTFSTSCAHLTCNRNPLCSHTHTCNVHAGNDGDNLGKFSGTGTVIDPSNAKNCLSVAATSNWQWRGPDALLLKNGSRVSAYTLVHNGFIVIGMGTEPTWVTQCLEWK